MDFVIKSCQIGQLRYPLLTPLLILKAIHRLQQQTLSSFHYEDREDHKEDEEETLVQYATYHTRFLKRSVSKIK